jgi:hypothetical protein
MTNRTIHASFGRGKQKTYRQSRLVHRGGENTLWPARRDSLASIRFGGGLNKGVI